MHGHIFVQLSLSQSQAMYTLDPRIFKYLIVVQTLLQKNNLIDSFTKASGQYKTHKGEVIMKTEVKSMQYHLYG